VVVLVSSREVHLKTTVLFTLTLTVLALVALGGSASAESPVYYSAVLRQAELLPELAGLLALGAGLLGLVALGRRRPKRGL
jgi:hypothetical protein